jgi:hypothetical protein
MISATAPIIRSQGLALLEQMLAAGWSIENPVVLRPAWATRERCYHFVLHRLTQRSLVVLPDAPEIHRFLRLHQLTLE